MKQLLYSFCLLLSLNVLAQTDKGDLLLGGSLGFQTGEGSNSFNFDPNVGFFVGDNFAIGGKLSFQSSKLGALNTSTFGLGPFARYYFGSTSTKPFAVTEFDFLSTSFKTNGQKTTSSGFGWLIGLGFAAFINESIAVEGVSGYNYAKFKDADGSGGFALRFGFQVYLNRKSVSALKTNVLGN
jgi:hypothetical protein